MATKTRVANKTIWACEDIIAHCERSDTAIETAIQRARDRHGDAALLIALTQVRSDLASIRILASDARHGQYRDSGGHNDE